MSDTVGSRIRTARQKKGITKADLARRASVDKGNLSKVEAGARGLSAAALMRVARALDVNPEYLAGLTRSSARG